MSLHLSTKIASLLWIPNGEVDDTRFEKLFDDLAKLVDAQIDRAALLREGLLPTLRVRQHANGRLLCFHAPDLTNFCPLEKLKA